MFSSRNKHKGHSGKTEDYNVFQNVHIYNTYVTNIIALAYLEKSKDTYTSLSLLIVG